jgi:predicted aminopeptidase
VNFCFFLFLLFIAWNYKTAVYLIHQVNGELALLSGTQSLKEFEATASLKTRERENLQLVSRIKSYSVDSLHYKPTENYTSIYDQRDKPVLWVITASEAYALEPFEWVFPVVGKVSYKGFFRKDLAEKEYNHLIAIGYDADIRPVSAWSTLGWLHDPILSSMLKRSKGSLCNLFFHELFHATYYAPSSVDFNENIASFVAHKATQRFLRNDTAALREYLQNFQDNKTFNDYMLRRIAELKKHYKQTENDPGRFLLKLKAIAEIADSVGKLDLHDPARYLVRKKETLKFKNAYFIDFVQYDSMQDSLEEVFNKFYAGRIEKLVQDLRLN